jgi:WD domain, G-beta repeat
MRHGDTVTSAQFNPDGQRVLTASVDTARQWDVLSGKPIGEPMRHEARLRSAQFSPDGQWVVTASGDNTARLWDALSGKPIGDPIRHGDTVTSAQFSPDGQRVVTASVDNTARLWDFPTISNKDSAEDLRMLADLAEATGGIALQASGQEEIQNALTSEEIQAIRKKIATSFSRPSSELTPLQRLLKWSVSDPRDRTISPSSQLTVAEWIENTINEGTLDGLRAAMQVYPANARLTAHLGQRLADQALETRTDPDAARRARAEADFQTRRALKLAPDNDEVKKLRAHVVQLLKLPE